MLGMVSEISIKHCTRVLWRYNSRAWISPFMPTIRSKSVNQDDCHHLTERVTSGWVVVIFHMIYHPTLFELNIIVVIIIVQLQNRTHNFLWPKSVSTHHGMVIQWRDMITDSHKNVFQQYTRWYDLYIAGAYLSLVAGRRILYLCSYHNAVVKKVCHRVSCERISTDWLWVEFSKYTCTCVPRILSRRQDQ